MNAYETMVSLLKQIVGRIKDDKDCKEIYWLIGLIQTIDYIAKKALAVPRRNCDVGTAEEQYERYLAFCDKYGTYCGGCPCGVHTSRFACCFAKWAQMPYQEGGEGCPEAINR